MIDNILIKDVEKFKKDLIKFGFILSPFSFGIEGAIVKVKIKGKFKWFIEVSGSDWIGQILYSKKQKLWYFCYLKLDNLNNLQQLSDLLFIIEDNKDVQKNEQK